MEQAIAQHIQNTLSAHQETRASAEAALSSAEQTPGFPLALLRVVAAHSDLGVRVTSAVYFKNLIKRLWAVQPDTPDRIAADDRVAIKTAIVDLMISSPNAIQLQLSEAVTMIADTDFPDQWPNLVPLLVSKLDASNYDINVGVLQTAHSIFKRWRHQVESNKLFAEIKMVLDQFALPFFEFFKATDALVDSNSGNPKALAVLFNSILLLTKIFYSLNCQEYPEFFEDNHEALMALLKKYLLYNNPALETRDNEEVGPIEKVKSSICEIIDLYGSKYEEDFKTLPQFVETVWGVLVTTGLQPKYDELVSKAIGFLVAVVRPVRHKHMFSPEVLKNICQSIIIPNMTLREADVELFQDEPMEYIRRDLEGSEMGTRRGAATDLIRGLLAHFAQEITSILSEYLGLLLGEYSRDIKMNWKAKDSALYLIIAVSAKASSLQSGVTSVNEYIDTISVFASNVLPDLQSPVNGPTESIIKVDALKYVLTFRNQLSKEQLLQVFPFIVQHLSSTNYAVFTYASVCIERILAMKAGSKTMFTNVDIQQYTQAILLRIFDIIETNGSSSEKLAENDYLMKALMRVVLIARDDATSYVSQLLTRLTKIIDAIAKNPSNPKFNHYAFETVGILIRNVCQNNSQVVSEFETFLFPPFQSILQQDVAEFMPYVFQLMSQMLSIHKEAGIPPAYSVMLQPLLTPALWESHGNIPALVGLLESFLEKGASQIVQGNQLTPILGIYHKLISSRMNDNFGMDLILSVYENVSRLFKDLFTSIILPGLAEMVQPEERKLFIIGMTNLLTGSSIIISDQYLSLWPLIIETQIQLIKIPAAENADLNAEDEFYIADVEEAGYQASFARLSAPAKKSGGTAAGVRAVDPKQYFVQRMTAFRSSPGAARIPPENFAFLS
ncbi:Exportin-2 [Physocladia obscura]|uniref:Exportin-2 n=1 Tax=Physocladia obscura TaxID=109957 RepID=A0AAD5XBY9_9FUNG|nr:Exportin-2 [Physocladia obscura]